MANISDATKRAIEAFKASIVAEEAAERANQVLNRLVTQIPPEELGAYINQTEGFR